MKLYNGCSGLFMFIMVAISMLFTLPAKAEVDWSMYPHQLTVIAFFSSTSTSPATLRTDTWQREFYTLQKCQEAEATTRTTKVPRVSGDSATVVSYITYCDPVVQH